MLPSLYWIKIHRANEKEEFILVPISEVSVDGWCGALGPVVGWSVSGPCGCYTRGLFTTQELGNKKRKGLGSQYPSQGLSSNTKFPLRSLHFLFCHFQTTAWAGHDPFSIGGFLGIVEILTMWARSGYMAGTQQSVSQPHNLLPPKLKLLHYKETLLAVPNSVG